MASLPEQPTEIATQPKRKELPWFFWKDVLCHSDPKSKQNMKLVCKEMYHLVRSNYKNLPKERCTSVTFTEEDGQHKPPTVYTLNLRQYECKSEEDLWRLSPYRVYIDQVCGINPSLDESWFKEVETIFFFKAFTHVLEGASKVFAHVKYVYLHANRNDSDSLINLGNGESFKTVETIRLDGYECIENFNVSPIFLKNFAGAENPVYMYKRTKIYASRKEYVYCIARESTIFLTLFQGGLRRQRDEECRVNHELTVFYQSLDFNEEWMNDNNVQFQRFNEEGYTMFSLSCPCPYGFYQHMRFTLYNLRVPLDLSQWNFMKND